MAPLKMTTTELKSGLIKSWRSRLSKDFDAPQMQVLVDFLNQRASSNKKIFPQGSDYFRALNSVDFDSVKVVILGQDPYHGQGQAHGLAFSVSPGVPLPPSLKNIFKELKSDLGVETPNHGCLQAWADQGVMLLNAVLTVEEALPGSHQGKGWEVLTDRVIELLSSERENLVFVLWGAFAQKKSKLIDHSKHLVIEGPHPSPLSSYRGFFGSRPFSTANKYLVKSGNGPVDWSL
jgi:uracil-DNA glycosylase